MLLENPACVVRGRLARPRKNGGMASASKFKYPTTSFTTQKHLTCAPAFSFLCYIMMLRSCILMINEQTPHELLPKLFGPLRERYADRPGGYTRVLRIEPLKEDQAPSAILELVDGPKDMRFAMTARTLARKRAEDEEMDEMTQRNVEKTTTYRKDGMQELEKMVEKLKGMKVGERDNSKNTEKRWGGVV